MSDIATPPQAELRPAEELAAGNRMRFAGESADYRQARTELLAEEIALRRQIQRVAEQRRALPPGPVAGDYRFLDDQGREIGLIDLFGKHIPAWLIVLSIFAVNLRIRDATLMLLISMCMVSPPPQAASCCSS